ANAHSVLHEDPLAYERAGRGILGRLRAVAAAPEELPERPPAIGPGVDPGAGTSVGSGAGSAVGQAG
ncbi:hypothetical protein ACFV17_21275, partial [Streptomyces sp. NPDC059656]